MKKFLLLALAVVMLASLGATTAAAQTNLPAAGTNAPAKQALPKLLDLGADRCVPCKMMAPILAEMKTNYVGKLEVEFIDVWKNSDAGKKHGVTVIPTQIFYDADGKELFRHIGFYSKDDILAKWKELGVDLKK